MTTQFMLEPGGSGNGVTTALKRMRCPRMAYFAAQKEAEYAGTKVVGTNGALVGTLCHAFCEMYSQGHDFEPADVEFLVPEGYILPPDYESPRVEAVRVFEAFKKKYTPCFMGTLLHAEKFFEYDAGGPKMLTAKIDALMRFDGANELGLPKGTYIIDYKFLSSFGPNSVREYEYSPQAAWYQYVARFYGIPVDGTVFVIGVRTQKPRFEVVQFKGFNNDAMQELIQNMNEELNPKRTYACNGKYGSCSFMGVCLGKTDIA